MKVVIKYFALKQSFIQEVLTNGTCNVWMYEFVSLFLPIVLYDGLRCIHKYIYLRTYARTCIRIWVYVCTYMYT